MTSESLFKETFLQLKQVLTPFQESLEVVIDESNNFYLDTHYIMKNKKPMYFGSVKINKNYVSFHLMPVYVFPELLKDLSPELKKRMQGKSCFNFKTLDDQFLSELSALTKEGYAAYEKSGYL